MSYSMSSQNPLECLKTIDYLFVKQHRSLIEGKMLAMETLSHFFTSFNKARVVDHKKNNFLPLVTVSFQLKNRQYSKSAFFCLK